MRCDGRVVVLSRPRSSRPGWPTATPRPPARPASRANHYYFVPALAAVVLSAALAGCALVGPDPRSPGEVAQAFFVACDAGDYEEAQRLSSEGLRSQLAGGVGDLFGGIEGFCAYHTRDGELVEVEVLEEATEGLRAEVTLGYRFEGPAQGYGEFGDGETALTTWQMSREDAGWKLAPSD